MSKFVYGLVPMWGSHAPCVRGINMAIPSMLINIDYLLH